MERLENSNCHVLCYVLEFHDRRTLAGKEQKDRQSFVSYIVLSDYSSVFFVQRICQGNFWLQRIENVIIETKACKLALKCSILKVFLSYSKSFK